MYLMYRVLSRYVQVHTPFRVCTYVPVPDREGGELMDTTNINLLSLIGRDVKLKKVAGTGGGEWHSACPFCGGKDRFRVQPHHKPARYACRNCGASGDAISYVQRRDNVDFLTACAILGLRLSEQRADRAIRPAPPQRVMTHHVDRETATPSQVNPDAPALTDAAYQAAAVDFCFDAINTLHSGEGERARQWLHQRGLIDPVLLSNSIGYNPTDQRTTWGNVPVWLPRGIVIPWHVGGAIWRVNFRRPVGDPKYISAKGWASGLYLADTLEPGCIALLVEGEFDALLIRRLCPDLIHAGLRPVATGSTTGGHALRWVTALSLAERVLVAFDTDEPGQQAAQFWLDALDNAHRLNPLAHDVTDMFKADLNIRNWIVGAFPDLNRRSILALPNHAQIVKVNSVSEVRLSA